MTVLLCSILSYLLGSIPFGLILVRLKGLGDIRCIGSGNIGATNVLRTGNKGLALATCLLDSSKGIFAIACMRLSGFDELSSLALAAAVIGHMYPVWLGFKGGKGVATYAGSLLMLFWPLGLQAICVWYLALRVWNYSSLAALIATFSVPASIFIWSYDPMLLYATLPIPLIWWRHKDNIRRLCKGEEPKVGEK